MVSCLVGQMFVPLVGQSVGRVNWWVGGWVRKSVGGSVSPSFG